jgi:hypothetical protein
VSIRALLQDVESRWLSHESAAHEQETRTVASEAAIPLPSEYVELLQCVNGGEAQLTIDPWWLQLWSTREVGEHNRGYEVAQWHPGYHGFGSSGGGVMFAFKKDSMPESKVFGVPFDSIDPEDVYVIANDLTELVKAIGERPERATF